MHRDSNNVGPSLTKAFCSHVFSFFISTIAHKYVRKAFGDFQGGALRYWGEDDGSLTLEELERQSSAMVLETDKALCLFDGRRAHSVAPYVGGERYSLVFFCTEFD